MSDQEPAVQGNSLCLKIFQPLRECISNFTFGHPVHPLDPSGPKFSEYLYVKPTKRLRIIHVKPNVKVNDRISSVIESRRRTSHNSLSEEYWFTQWNKPLKLGNCNCSFRRSDRYQSFRESKRSRDICVSSKKISSYNLPPTKITNIETFVERLIQDTLFEAYQEYFMKQVSVKSVEENGTRNLGFTEDEDEFDGVVVRHPSKFLKHHHLEVKPNKCSHRKLDEAKKKPLVILLHGIGSSADVWWNIINTLIHKGYEIVAPDLLGHGYSSIPNKSSAYKFNNLLKHIVKIFDHYVGCDESKKSIVIGHSYGCSLATALYRQKPQQIVQLILISGGGPTPLAPQIQQNNESILSFLRMVFQPLLFCGLKRALFYSPRGKHFYMCNENNAIPNHILEYIYSGQNWPEGDAAFHRKILIPTLLVHGLNDTQITLVQECEMERTVPRAFLELIPNAGHMSMLDTPEHLSHMIMCFIDWWSR